ncbi:MAG TPA: XRE family transcriptional regulator [Campylobacterales bacterium]|nr:XRE family transcriptional regulator [Campylobacterales bacterium]
MKNYKLILGNNIKIVRNEQKISQEKLAEISSLHRTYIGSVERGERNISLENMIIIAKALDVKLCRLLEGVE